MFSDEVHIDYSLLIKNKVPILIQDKSWQKLFGKLQNKRIQKAKSDLEECLKEEKLLTRKLHKSKNDKKKIMEKILELSDEVNNKGTGDIENLRVGQDKLFEKNTEIEDLTFKLEMMPKRIKEANLIVLKETIRLAYKELKEKEAFVEASHIEMNELRDRLRELIDKKHNYEEKISRTYRFLHGVLGSKEMEKLDKTMF